MYKFISVLLVTCVDHDSDILSDNSYVHVYFYVITDVC